MKRTFIKVLLLIFVILLLSVSGFPDSSQKVINSVPITVRTDHPNEASPEYEWAYRTASVRVTRSANQKVFIAGNSTGTAGFGADDAMYINNRGFKTLAGSYVQSRGPLPQSVLVDPIEITSMIPAGVNTTLNFKIVDVGVKYGCTDIYLVWKGQAGHYDIAVSDITLDNNNLIRFELQNRGSLPINDDLVTDLKIGGRWIDNLEHKVNLSPGQKKVFPFKNKTLDTRTTVEISTDSYNILKENNENNNTLRKKLGAQAGIVKLTKLKLTRDCEVWIEYMYNARPPKQITLVLKDKTGRVLKCFRNPGLGVTPHNGSAGFNTHYKLSGSETITAIIDADNEVKEKNENDNSKTEILKCPLPDLVLEDIKVNNNCFVKYSVRNQGDAAVHGQVEVRITQNNYLDRSMEMFNLSAGQSREFTSRRVKIEEPTGVTVEIDSGQAIEESNEQNNRLTRQLRCSSREEPEKNIDLGIQDMGLFSGSHPCTVSVTLRNHTNQEFSGDVPLYLQVNNYTRLDVNKKVGIPRRLIWLRGVVIPPMRDKKFETSYELGSMGEYEIQAEIDPADRLKDKNRANNKLIKKLKCEVYLLKIKNWYPGKDCSLFVEIENKGNVAVEREVTAKASSNQEPRKIGEQKVKTYIEPGKPKIIHFPEIIITGERKIVAVEIQWYGIRNQKNPYSDKHTSMITCSNGFDSQENNLPDLTFLKIDAPAEVIQYDSVAASASFINNGKAPAGKFRLRCSVKVPGGGTGNIYKNYGGLAPGATGTINIPMGTAATGDYQITCVIDCDNEVVESDETNNKSDTTTTTVKPR